MSDPPVAHDAPAALAGFLGRVPFGEAWELQRKIWRGLAEGRSGGDVFLFLEHGPVFTLGTGGSEAHIVSRRLSAGEAEVPVVRVNRGGEVTFHGPGQLMMYAICRLTGSGRDVHAHCRRLEEVFLRYLSGAGFEARRREDMPGLWVEGEKILSLGVGARRWVTMHGVAFNVAPDLRYFGRIHPCGEVGARVTSLERLLGKAPPLREVAGALIPICREVFGREVIWSEGAPEGLASWDPAEERSA